MRNQNKCPKIIENVSVLLVRFLKSKRPSILIILIIFTISLFQAGHNLAQAFHSKECTIEQDSKTVTKAFTNKDVSFTTLIQFDYQNVFDVYQRLDGSAKYKVGTGNTYIHKYDFGVKNVEITFSAKNATDVVCDLTLIDQAPTIDNVVINPTTFTLPVPGGRAQDNLLIAPTSLSYQLHNNPANTVISATISLNQLFAPIAKTINNLPTANGDSTQKYNISQADLSGLTAGDYKLSISVTEGGVKKTEVFSPVFTVKVAAAPNAGAIINNGLNNGLAITLDQAVAKSNAAKTDIDNAYSGINEAITKMITATKLAVDSAKITGTNKASIAAAATDDAKIALIDKVDTAAVAALSGFNDTKTAIATISAANNSAIADVKSAQDAVNAMLLIKNTDVSGPLHTATVLVDSISGIALKIKNVFDATQVYYDVTKKASDAATLDKNAADLLIPVAVANKAIVEKPVEKITPKDPPVEKPVEKVVVDPNIPPVNDLGLPDLYKLLSPDANKNAVVTAPKSPPVAETLAPQAYKTTVAVDPNVPVLKPTPDILNCSSPVKILYFEKDLPANKFTVSCTLGGKRQNNSLLINNSAIVLAKVYNKSYDPKKEDNTENEIKTIWIPKQQEGGSFTVSWDGFDNYDQPVTMGEYVFMVGAKINATYKTDQSITKFKIENAPIEIVTNTNLHGAAEKTAEKTTDLSKCPGVYYPTDIAGNRSEVEIKEAYDKCIINSVEGSLFQPNSQLTRAEAIKIILLAIGKKADENCTSPGCGSPFGDASAEQSSWIKTAWEAKIINENVHGSFYPSRKITKAESYSMIVKAWNIKPHEKCYSPDCGAGYPNNIFKDVKQAWQGPYLRALWDLGVIKPVSKNKIYPDSKPTRASFIKEIIDVEKKQGK